MKLIDNVTAPMKRVADAINQANKKIEATKARADKAFASAANIKHAADGVMNFAAKMSDGLLDVVKQASDFEQAMLGVAKQVQGARDSSGKLTDVYFDMAKQVQMLGREMPIATNEIAKMVAAGARMDIPKDELIEFVKTAGMMSAAFELPADELADNMGKIKLLFGIKTQEELRGLADSINYLDDNAISKGGEIIQFLQRAGSVAGSIAITGKEMTAIGSTLLTLGDHSMRAGTSVNAMFSLFAAADEGSARFKDAMHQIGLSTKEVQAGMQVDSFATFLKIVDKINALPKENRIGAMVKLVGMDHSDTLAKLVAGAGELRKQIGLVNSEQAKGSMNREYQANLATTEKQWEIMKNRAAELGVKLGAVLLPEINKLFDVVGPLVSKTANWIEKNPELAKTLGRVAAAITATAFALGGLMTALAAIVATKGLLMLAGGFTAVFAPAILAGIAIGSVALAVNELVKAWESFDALEVLKGMSDVAGEAVMNGDNPAFAIAKQWLDPRALMDSIGLTGEKANKGLLGTPFSMLGDAVAPGAGVGPLRSLEAMKGELVIKFDENGRPQVGGMKSTGLDLEVQSTSGRMMQ